ncbi:zinc finger protein 846-like [Maniola jurtina]|uniref:zinc finger protein 846-like n=1 Tax=Maniola jurtina TaxID=191418 RepID=UPI001E68F855|nr:zinc finger protein 846-like [Maniola jurtina]
MGKANPYTSMFRSASHAGGHWSTALQPACSNATAFKELSNIPSEVHLRAAWLRALGKQDNLPDSAVVCSQHFLNEDIYETESGSRQIRSHAVPSTVQVCMICLDTDSKLILMSKYALEESYEKLTGEPLCDQGNLKPTPCVQCAQRLINFNRFRDKSLRARALMMDLVQKHGLITGQHIKLINRTKHQLKSNMVFTTLGPDHCDLHILEHPSEDNQKELEETRLESIIKIEGNDESMTADEDMKMENEDDNNVSDFIRDPLKYESAPFQCTFCWEEFVHEHAYMQHMCTYLQDGNGDGEYETSQVSKPHTAVSSSSAHSALSTEMKHAGPSTSTHAAMALVIPDKEPANEDTDAVRESKPVFELNNGAFDNHTSDISCKRNINISRLTNCVVKLYDIFKNPKVNQNIASKDINYHANEIPTTVDVGPDINTVKALQSKTDCLKNDNNMQCNNSLENSSHVEERGFICDICRKMYNRKCLLVKHIKTHSEVGLFTCNICQYKCKYQSYLKIHMRTHTGEKPFLCKLCNYRCIQSSYLVQHMRTHTGDRPFSCKLCDYKCATNSSLVTHMRTHTGIKPFLCNLCNYKCTENSTLVTHMRTHTGERPFSCKSCNYKCATNSTLVMHMRTHTGQRPFPCKLCDYKCARNSTLVKHMRTHTGEKPFSCKLCNYKCARNDTLVRHMGTHTGKKPYSCKICEYKCANSSHLVQHMRTHTGIKPFLCNLCNYKCTQSSSLVQHMRTHTGERPVSCKLCNYKCSQSSHLVQHMRTHTGIKPFLCNLCYYKCTQSNSLVQHMRAHTGERPFLCELCDYKCARNSTLVTHMRTHTKPYSCKICKYKCAHKASLMSHIRTHTAIGETPSSSS